MRLIAAHSYQGGLSYLVCQIESSASYHGLSCLVCQFLAKGSFA